MPLIEYTLEGKINKVDIAVKRIRTFDPIATGLFDTPYYVAYSGGKDSDVIRILCELAGVKHDLMHNHTTVDAPETVRYVRSIVLPENIIYPKTSMWKEIEYRGLPTRVRRWCCVIFKEGGGQGRFCMTGVRRAESAKRKSRGGVEIVTRDAKNKIILNADNDDSRMMLESCIKKGKRVLNPIIDWVDSDVWEFLQHYGCPSNPLYQEGFTRIGCIGCPNADKQRETHWERWPRYKDNYLRAAQRYIDGHPDGICKTGEELFCRWMRNKPLDQIDGQEILEDY